MLNLPRSIERIIMSVLRGLGCHVLTALIVTSRKRTITAWSAGLSSRLASNHGLHGFFIRLSAVRCTLRRTYQPFARVWRPPNDGHASKCSSTLIGFGFDRTIVPVVNSMALLTADAKGMPRSTLCSFFHDFDRVIPFASFHLKDAFGIHLRSVML